MLCLLYYKPKDKTDVIFNKKFQSHEELLSYGSQSVQLAWEKSGFHLGCWSVFSLFVDVIKGHFITEIGYI